MIIWKGLDLSVIKNDSIIVKNNDWNDIIEQYDLQNQDREILIHQKKVTQQTTKTASVTHRSFWPQRGLMFVGLVALLGNVPVSSHLLEPQDSSSKSFEIALNKTTHSAHLINEQTTTAEVDLEQTINKTSSVALQHKRANELEPPQELELPSRALETYAGHTNVVANGNWKTYHVKSYDNLTNIFYKLGHQKSLKVLQKNPKIAKALKKIKKNSIARAKSVNGKLAELIFTSDNNSYILTSTDDGYHGTWKKNIFEVRQARANFTINNGLFFDGRKAGVSDKIVKQIVKVFDWDIDFSHDIRIGDNITAVFEEIYHDGDKIDSGHLLAAEFINKGHVHRAIRYTFKNGKADYFTPQGREMKKAFIRTPIAHARVSSHFNPGRFHPVLHKLRAHKGTDFAARTGTAIMATGNGTIKFIGRKGGYGRMVIISHREGYETRYGHMSRYAKGLKAGDKIYQGDVIGYVGRSGLATGPHLHYEFRRNGKAVNPMTVSLPNSMSLDRKELADFRNHAINLVLQLNVLHRFAKAKIDINSAFGG